MDRSYARRRLLGLVPAAVAVALTGDTTWATGNDQCREEWHPCEGNQDCCDGLTCVQGGGQGNAKRCVKHRDPECHDNDDCPGDGVCVDDTCEWPEPSPCDNDSHCPDDCVCHDGGCAQPTIINGVIVYVPINVTSSGGKKRRKRRRRKHRRNRKH